MTEKRGVCLIIVCLIVCLIVGDFNIARPGRARGISGMSHFGSREEGLVVGPSLLNLPESPLRADEPANDDTHAAAHAVGVRRDVFTEIREVRQFAGGMSEPTRDRSRPRCDFASARGSDWEKGTGVQRGCIYK